MTHRQFFDRTAARLTSIYPQHEAEAIARILFEDMAGLSRADIAYAATVEFVDCESAEKIEKALERLLKNEPLQYILGKAWFYDMDFEVNKSVLIPRPETEELVRLIIEENNFKKCSVLDIGTGSGCIAVSLGKFLDGAEVTAVDVSKNALCVATRNAELNGVKVNFEKCDILSEKPVGRFDIIVSNPPYVLDSEREVMRNNVLDYEPHLALFVPDTDPLLFYRVIADYAKVALRAHGKLYFEINSSQGEAIVKMLEGKGFSDAAVVSDIFDRQRIVKAVWR